MPTLLHIDASANRAPESVSRRLSAAFAADWRSRWGSAGYRYRDLAADPVPFVDQAFTALGRRSEARGTVDLDSVPALVATPEEGLAWEQTRPLIDEVRTAATILLGVPMYNLGVPASLKAWIDRVTFPGAFTDHLRTTTVVVAAARGGSYRPGRGEAFDFQVPYLRAWFSRIGVTEERFHAVTAELTVADLLPHLVERRDEAAASLASAHAQLAGLAGRCCTGP